MIAFADCTRTHRRLRNVPGNSNNNSSMQHGYAKCGIHFNADFELASRLSKLSNWRRSNAVLSQLTRAREKLTILQ